MKDNKDYRLILKIENKTGKVYLRSFYWCKEKDVEIIHIIPADITERDFDMDELYILNLMVKVYPDYKMNVDFAIRVSKAIYTLLYVGNFIVTKYDKNHTETIQLKYEVADDNILYWDYADKLDLYASLKVWYANKVCISIEEVSKAIKETFDLDSKEPSKLDGYWFDKEHYKRSLFALLVD